ncbi:YmfQ family protein [Chromobacterium haemolyticum]|uniref:YmfQ family protein n=1 Tax=Chromobacterium haemolyticum TaxID=394935 RepID=UPI000DEEAA4E|nr:putative phage tail protein [Chromobacterium haemolyticum]
MAISAGRYAQHLAALLPPGLALQAEGDSELAQLLGTQAEVLAAIDSRAQLLLQESDPRRSVLLLTEWETSLGLPDACTLGEQTLLARQQAVLAKLTDIGGARVPRYLRMAESLGYPGATITRHRYHHCEMSCEAPLNDSGWRHSWTLNLPSGAKITEATTESGVEESLRTWGDSMIECVIHREAPACSTALVAYGGMTI